MNPKIRKGFFGWFLLALLMVVVGTGCQTTRKFTPQELAILKDAGFVETEDGDNISLEGRILFEHTSAELSEESHRVIAGIVVALKKLRIEHVRVEGHTDRTGTESYNQKLSVQRAQAVAEELVARGISLKNIVVVGLAEKHQIASNQTAEGRAQNRRAVIIVPAY